MSTEVNAKIAALRERRADHQRKMAEIDEVLNRLDAVAPLPDNEDELIEQYISLRDAKAASAGFQKARDAAVNTRMTAIENALMDRLREGGLQSLGGKSGTAYLQQKTAASVTDWEAVLQFATTNDRLDLLGKHISKDAVKEYMEANDGATPPGVSWFTTPSISIRRS